MDQLCLLVDDWHQVDELKNFRDKVVIGLMAHTIMMLELPDT